MPSDRFDLYGLSRQELHALFADWNFSAVHAARLWRYLYFDLIGSFGGMTELPIRVRAKLEMESALGMPAVARATDSADGFTRK